MVKNLATMASTTGDTMEISRQHKLHVPMIIHWPGKAAGTSNTMTSHYDITPTLMSEALGCKNPLSDYSIGSNLYDKPNHDWIRDGKLW